MSDIGEYIHIYVIDMIISMQVYMLCILTDTHIRAWTVNMLGSSSIIHAQPSHKTDATMLRT